MAKSRNRCLPMNINPEELMTGTLKLVVGFSCTNHCKVELMCLIA